MEDEKEETPQARGGRARAAKLSPQERSEIASKASAGRWHADLPQATHEGELTIGEASLRAAVLPSGKRVLSQGTFLQALGRSRTPKAGTGALTTVDGLPFFLQAEQLKPFISEELRLSTTPLFFLASNGRRAVGYDAELLPMVCDVYLQLRDQSLKKTGKLPHQYERIIEQCDLLVRGLARVGIIALVDEATGYQETRDRLALQAILDKFLRKDFAAWAKTFPDEFYKQIFRLRNWTWRGMSVNRPQVVAHYTNDIVYMRLAPGLLEELAARNPKDSKGRRKGNARLLTEDIGHPALSRHLHAVLGLMRASESWSAFMKLLDLAFPKFGSNYMLNFMSAEDSD